MQHGLTAVVLAAAVSGVLWSGGALGAEEQALPRLRVFHRSGQTFATWTEVGGPGVTYNLYRDDEGPITTDNLAQAELVATGVPQGTARDLIAENVARFWKREPVRVNLTVLAEEGPLPAGTGLFVYTPKVERTSFYALTAVWPEGGEDRRAQPGVNSQPEKVVETTAPPTPILIATEQEGEDVRLEYLHWATPELASIDGYPYRFRVVVKAKERGASAQGLIVRLHPYTGNYSQTKWTRPGLLTLGLDDFTPAIGKPPYHHSFWCGYREDVGPCYLTGASAERAGGVCRWRGKTSDDVPFIWYTRRRILWTINYVVREFQVDANRVYLTGSSMGGDGTLSFGFFQHPEMFAALDANVPPSPKTKHVRSGPVDRPMLKFFNARQDRAIDWTKVVPFIRALEEARQPFVVAWDNGGHGGPRPQVSTSFRSYDIYRIRRNQCVPALSNASTADDPGSGERADGDLVGSINDDFRWEVERDTKAELILRLWRTPKSGKFAEVTEATVDVTPRRRQAFVPEPGEEVTLRNLSAADGSVMQEMQLRVEPSGLLTARGVRIGLEPGGRLVFTTGRGVD